MGTVSSVVGIVGGLVALWQLWLRWRAFGVSRVCEKTATMRNLFDEVVAQRGRDSSHFLGSAEKVEEELRYLGARLRDRRLREAVAALDLSWRETAAAAVPASLYDAYTPETWTPPPGLDDLIARQIESACGGQAAASRVLDRCRDLTRRLIVDV